ncbi:DinB family protein [Roseivirga sp.]|uniref:DinB family protein n=1 Tax=Roseivirga sp. TaxID=1964215 RepID=UPI003B8DD988
MKTNTKFSALTVVLLLTTTVLLTSMKPVEEKGGYDWMKGRLDAAKSFTIEVLKAMPEDDYDYKPNDDQRTFAAQAYHIAYSVEYFHKAFSQPNAAWQPGDENSKSKEELLKWAEAKFDEMHAFILASDANDQLTAGILYYLDHNSHHRGQVVTYLRMKGIKPPVYK